MYTRTGLNVDVYKDKNDEWRWKAKSSNGRIMADGGEGYDNKRDLLDALIYVLGVDTWDAIGGTFGDTPTGYRGTRSGKDGAREEIVVNVLD